MAKEKQRIKMSCHKCTKFEASCIAWHPPNEECFSPKNKEYLHFNKKKEKKSPYYIYD